MSKSYEGLVRLTSNPGAVIVLDAKEKKQP